MPPSSLLTGVWTRLNGSLRARLFIPIAVLSVASLGSMVWAAVQIHGADMDRAATERAFLFARLAADGFKSHMVEAGDDNILAMIGAIKGHRAEIASVSLLNEEGRVSFSSNQSLVGMAPWPTTGSHLNQVLDQGTTFAVLRSFPNEEKCVRCHDRVSKINGYMAIEFSKAPTTAAEQRLTSALLMAAAPALALLLGVLLWLVRREAIMPIQRLVVAMRRAEAGDVDVRADEGRPDEIGIAARNFDATMEALRKSRAELEKTYEARMLEAGRFAMVGQMATGLAHEIKNPLAGLSGALELLAEDLISTRHGEVVGEMRHQVQRLAQIMEGLLDFARPRKAQLRATNVNRALEKVLFLVSQQRGNSRVLIHRDFEPALPAVNADQAQLEQVFLNICLNAHEAINGKGGSLWVRSYSVGLHVNVEFADDGPGIPPEVQPNIFAPFFTTRPKGTGLGLAISARLVAENGGSINFRCPPEGGTVFTITLPALPGGQALVEPEGPARESA